MVVFSIIQKSQLEGAKRLDAEYYQPEYLGVAEKLKNAPKISELTSDIRYGLYVEPEYKNDGISFVRATNLLNFWIGGKILKIDEKKAPKDYRLKTGDSLIVRSGANTGCVGLIYPELEDATFGSYTIRLRFDKINPFFASVFLNSKYGILQTQKLQTGMAQPNLNIPNIKEIKIPTISENKQKEIEVLCIKIEEEKKKSENFYTQAEGLLLEELGLTDFENKESLYSIVNFSDVKNSNRIDAEYFHSKSIVVIEKIENHKGALEKLENLTTFINNGNQPPYSLDGEIRFFSQKWIKDKGIDYSFLTSETEPRVSRKFFEDKKNVPYLIKKYDILYYSVGANLGYCHNYLEDENIAIGSFINLIRPDEKKINPVYLGFLLNSIIGRAQSERDKSGLAQPYIYAKNLRKFLIPILPKETQQKIADLVRHSHVARKKAKELLEEAKQKVEDWIEKK